MALAAAVSPDGSASGASTSTASPAQRPDSATASTPSPLAAWRILQIKGLTPDEAANVTAFLYGLPTADLHWTLRQLNQLLFLQRMRQIGRVGGVDGGSNPRH